MMTYCCKCEHLTWYTSMGVPKCAWCDRCQTAPWPTKSGHPTVRVPHDFSMVEQVNTDEGLKPLTRCKFCLKTPAQLKKEEAS